MSYASEYAEALNAKFTEYDFTVEPGRKFDKIVQSDKQYGGRGVHVFVEKDTGFLIKAATWKAPQKSTLHPTGFAVRYDISTFEGFTQAINSADRHGGYLYFRG